MNKSGTPNFSTAVEVVRCKDCDRSYLADGYLMCQFWDVNGMDAEVCEDDYCSYGERGER